MTEKAKRPPTEAAVVEAGNDHWRVARKPVVLGLLLALMTAAVYVPVAWNGFVNYDDTDYVTVNSHVQSGLAWANVKWAFVTGHSSNWHPLTWISHMLDCQMFGKRSAGPHVVNVLFHVANTVLLFVVLRQMTGAVWRSAMVAALFGLHPLHVESVAWISERKDVLSTLFFLLTLWAYAKYGKSVERPMTRRMVFYAVALLFFALGLMSKPMLVTLPFVLLLLDYWPLGRGVGRVRAWAWLVIEKVPFFVLVASSSVVTFIVQKKGGAVSTSLTPGARVANAIVSYVRYLRKLFWPSDLAVLYPHPGHWPGWEVVSCAALLGILSVIIFILGWNRRYLIVGWLWYFGTLVPVIGLVQVGIQSMADRYTYIPAIGVFIMVIWGLSELVESRAEKVPGVAGVLALGAAVVLGVCGWLTVRQVLVWRDSETLFRQAVRATPKNYLAYNNLGYYLENEGRTAEGLGYYEDSLKINPDYPDALNNLGHAYANQRQYVKAIGLYERALRNQPMNVEVHNNLGNSLAETGKLDEAIEHYLITLKQNPEHADAHNNLGIALAMKGKLDEAIEQFQLALRYKPEDVGAHSNLGNALAAQHKLDEAIHEYETTLRLNPKDARAHNNLGNVLAEQGKGTDAIEQYREALRLNADNPEAECNLGLALLRANQRDEAIVHLKEALRLRPDYAQVRQQLKSLGVSGVE